MSSMGITPFKRGGSKPSKITPQQLARAGFFTFVILQTPTFMLMTPSAPRGMLHFSVLGVSSLSLAQNFPALRPVSEALLFPGTYVRDSVARLISCKWNKRDNCDASVLWDVQHVLKYNAIDVQTKVFNAPENTKKQFLEVGCHLLVIGGFVSMIVPVKMAVFGFALLGYGIWAGGLVPLPPGVMMAFLVSYGMFDNKSEFDKEREKELLLKKREQESKAATSTATGSTKETRPRGKRARKQPKA